MKHYHAQMTADAIGQRLQLIRRACGISQAEICRRTGITPPTWNNYEKGLHRVALAEAHKIRRATGATLDYIYLGDPKAMPFDLMGRIEMVRKLDAAAVAAAGKSRRKTAA